VNLHFTLGQTLFARTGDPAIQRLATLEAARPASLIVSFPKEGRAQRDDPIELGIDQLVSSDWIPNAPGFVEQDENFVAGRIMVAYRTETEVSFFLVLKNAEPQDPNVTVAPIILDAPGKMEVTAGAILVSKSSLLRPAFLCELEARRYLIDLLSNYDPPPIE
jgi:hypothetical protein